MTLITMGFDTELLIRQLRQRLAYVNGRIATENRRMGGDLVWTNANAAGALDVLEDERGWLQGLISQIEMSADTTPICDGCGAEMLPYNETGWHCPQCEVSFRGEA